MHPQQASFSRLVNNRARFRWYLFTRLPAAYFSGIRVQAVTPERCVASVPFKWLTRNPFRSTYFASLAMAAEMSTGLLALGNLYQRSPRVSMLVTGMEGSFFKKATGTVFFTCEDGAGFTEAIERAIGSGEATTFKARATGTGSGKEPVADFTFTWSFKVKSAH